MFKTDVYKERRNTLKHNVQKGLLLFIGNRLTAYTGPDSYYAFRQDSSFLYYCGINRPDLVLVIDCESGEEWLFGDNASESSVIWEGLKPSVEDLAQRTGIKKTLPLNQLSDLIKKNTRQGRNVHVLPPYRDDTLVMLHEVLDKPLAEIKAGASIELIRAVVKQRSIKDEFEIRELNGAADIAHKMLTTAIIMAMPGAFEQDIKGVIEGIAVSQGGAIAFQPIVTTRGDILHNERYTNPLEKGRMLVVDAGAESSEHYMSDITRSIPVGRTFSRLQKDIYSIVLDANQNAIDQIRPGVPYKTLHLSTAKKLAEGLKNLGIMKGDPDDAVNEGAHALFFPHGLGHMLGLDVHDMQNLGEDNVGYDSDYKRSGRFGLNHLRLAKPLAEGNVITVEPGIYFIPPLIERWRAEKKWSSFINFDQVDIYMSVGGIRIEDDVVVTASGATVLGKPVPKAMQEIEIV